MVSIAVRTAQKIRSHFAPSWPGSGMVEEKLLITMAPEQGGPGHPFGAAGLIGHGLQGRVGSVHTKRPMLSTIALSRNGVCPVTRMYSSIAPADQRFSSEIRRMPLSTPEVQAAIVITTATRTSAICSARLCGRPNSQEKPTFSSTTPMPIEVATPTTVPTRAKMSITLPAVPRTRLPSSG